MSSTKDLPLRRSFSLQEMVFIWDTLDGVYTDLWTRNSGDTFNSGTVDRLGWLDDVFKLMTGETTIEEVQP